MKTKIFLAGLVMAAAALCISCSDSREQKLKKIAKELDKLEEEIKNTPVPDNKITINPVLYQISDIHVVYDHHGAPTNDVNFGNDHMDHYRLLLPKENGGFEIGYVVKTTSGITIQANKKFYFYNDLGLKGRSTRELYNVVGIVRNDGSLIPMTIKVNGKDNQIMRKCKDSDVLTFVPLLRGVDVELSFTVKELKDYCYKNKLTIDAVPYLKFTN